MQLCPLSRWDAVLCAGFTRCVRRGRVWLTTLLWLEIRLLAKIGAWMRVLSPNLIAFENLVLTDKLLLNSLFCKQEYLPTAARPQFPIRCRTWCRSAAYWDWEELLSEQKYQLCFLNGIDYYACIFKNGCVCPSSSFAVWWGFFPFNVATSSTWHLSYSPAACKHYSLLFSKHNQLVFCLCIFLCCGYMAASAAIFLQPGIIAWNVSKQIFIQLQTYLCYWNQVLFVCILSDIILPDLPFGRKYSGKPILLPSARRKKKKNL